MRRRLLSRAIPLVALLALSSTACRHPKSPDGKRPVDDKPETTVQIRLPEPLPLPADPRAAAWIASPSQAIARLEPYSPVAVDARAAGRELLAATTTTELAELISAAIDLDAPFANVVLDEEEVIRLSISADQRTGLQAALAKLDKVGEFGAVALPRPPLAEGEPPPRAGRAKAWLAWIDEQDGGALVLANSERGLVTARNLDEAYGKQPVFFTLDPSALPLPIDVPVTRVRGEGDLARLHVDVVMTQGADPLAEIPIAAGTMSGLLHGPGVALGASSRYAEHEQTVKQVIAEVNAQVAELPFLMRGIGEDLAKKLNTTLRSWDGRLLVALGPSGHVRLAYGADDPEKAKVAALRLLQTVVDNIKLARNFVSEIPRVTLRRNVATGDGQSIDVVVLHDALGTVPSELRSLVDAERKLNVAMAWSERAGGGVIVVGPRAPDELARWLDETAKAPSGADTKEQLFAAMVAAEPTTLRTLMQAEPDMSTLLGLEAGGGPRWSIDIQPNAEGYAIDLVDLAAPVRRAK